MWLNNCWKCQVGFCLRNTMVKLFSPGHRSPSEESQEEYDENKAEEETKASLGERRQVRYFNCLMFGAMFIMIILCWQWCWCHHFCGSWFYKGLSGCSPDSEEKAEKEIHQYWPKVQGGSQVTRRRRSKKERSALTGSKQTFIKRHSQPLSAHEHRRIEAARDFSLLPANQGANGKRHELHREQGWSSAGCGNNSLCWPQYHLQMASRAWYCRRALKKQAWPPLKSHNSDSKSPVPSKILRLCQGQCTSTGRTQPHHTSTGRMGEWDFVAWRRQQILVWNNKALAPWLRLPSRDYWHFDIDDFLPHFFFFNWILHIWNGFSTWIH